MPRPPDHAAEAARVAASVEDLLRAVTVLIDDVRYAIVDSREVGSAAKSVGAAAKAKSAKLRRALKAYAAKIRGKAHDRKSSATHDERSATKKRKENKAR
jgi:predicted nucleic acid-binding Zn ribbon protein